MNILQNEYPYRNKNNVCTLLESIIQLQQSKSLTQEDYLITPTTLENMTCVSAKKGHSNIVMLVWEYLDLIHRTMKNTNDSHSLLYTRPSAGLYENAASAFAASGHQDHLVFGILAEMEKEGLKPSRPFLSRLAAAIRTRSSVKRLDNAIHMIRKSYKGDGGYDNNEEMTLKPTTSALNTVLAGYSDFGFSSKAMEIYHDFERLECTPDENTFLFMMDSVAMDISTAIPPIVRGCGENNRKIDDDEVKSWLNTQTDAADAIFEAAMEVGYGSNERLINSYVRILCAVGELDKALYLVDENFENRVKLSQEALGLLAVCSAEMGDFETVESIAEMSKQVGYRHGLQHHIMERIENLKREYDV